MIRKFETAGTVVVGVSKDTVESHQKFAGKYHLSFSLLSDPETIYMQKYGVYKEKKLYGKAYMGIVRTTFLIDEKGIVRKVWSKVKVEGHGQAVLDEVINLY